MIKRFLSVALLLLGALTGLRAQLNWEKTSGPKGCYVLDFAQDSTGKLWAIIDVSADERILTSTDDGQSWQVASLPFFQDKSVENMEVGPNGYLYLMNSESLFRSTDGGATWTAHSILAINWQGYYGSNFDFLPNGDLLMLGSGNLWTSSDFGETWAILTTFPGTIDAQTVKVLANGIMFLGNVGGSGWYELWRSTDGGQTFQQVNLNVNLKYKEANILCIEEVGNSLVMLIDSGFFRSLDNGLTWTLTYSSPSSAGRLQKAPDGKLYLVERHVRRSSDGGQTWVIASKVPRVDSYSSWYFLPTRDGSIILNTFELYRSTDEATTWEDVSQGLSYRYIESVSANPETGTVFAQANGLFKTSDLGQSWQLVFPASQFTPNNGNGWPISFTETGEVYVQYDDRLLHSPDDGTTWDTIQFAQSPLVVWSFSVAPSGKLFVETNVGYISSTDKGATWDYLPYPSISLGRFIAANDSLLFSDKFGSSSGYRSLDGGQNWVPMASPISSPSSFWRLLHWAKWGELFSCYDYQLFRSQDLGVTWTKVGLPPYFNEYINKIITTASGQVYVFANNYGLLYSDDYGLSWVKLMLVNQIGAPSANDQLVDFALVEGQMLFGGTFYESVWRTSEVAPFYAKITGEVKKDEDSNCAISPGDLPVENWMVTATGPNGSTAFASTDEAGHYRLGYLLPDSIAIDLQIEAHAPNYLWAVCDPVLTATVSQQIDTANHLDFSSKADIDCALLDVSINFWPARPCSTLTIVANYCNLGSILAADATLRIIVDPLITVNSTSLPIFSQSGDTLVFSLGNVGIGTCGSVSIVGTLGCDAVMGQSVCVEAHASPDSLCGSFPDWSGAFLFASAKCAGDSLVEFSVKNIGSAPSTSNLDYIVIEDQILLKTGSLPSMIPGQEMLLSEMPDGKTLRIEAEQEPGHPLSTFTAAWVEGCGTNPPSWGWILPYLGEDGDPFSATYCREVTTSYDPNAKEALPAGFGTEHFIRPGQSLDYFIQFQNTGNDTAFLVVLRDTLDAGLDPATVRMGASSHPMEWEIYGPGILKFVFKNILLPDSTTNEPASHGWVSFNIEQRPGLPLGTVIRNNVGIYFDSNPPVLTNQTWHTLGENFLPLAVEPSPESAPVLTVSPNPMGESAIFELKNLEIEGVFSLKIMDSAGRTIRMETVNGPRFEVFRKGLPAGLWFFSLEKPDGGPVVAHGKLLAR